MEHWCNDAELWNQQSESDGKWSHAGVFPALEHDMGSVTSAYISNSVN